MDNRELRAITTHDIDQETIKAACKAGLSFCKSTTMFGLYTNDVMVGFCGLILRKHVAVFKNVYVLPAHRLQGHFRCMFLLCMRIAVDNGCNISEATCTKSSLPMLKSYGFQVVQQYNTFTKVRHDNLSSLLGG